MVLSDQHETAEHRQAGSEHFGEVSECRDSQGTFHRNEDARAQGTGQDSRQR